MLSIFSKLVKRLTITNKTKNKRTNHGKGIITTAKLREDLKQQIFPTSGCSKKNPPKFNA